MGGMMGNIGNAIGSLGGVAQAPQGPDPSMITQMAGADLQSSPLGQYGISATYNPMYANAIQYMQQQGMPRPPGLEGPPIPSIASILSMGQR